MSVFLRWGVFGILGVAALLYAYNASKRMSEAHAAKAEQLASEPVAETAPDAAPVEPAQPEPEPAPPLRAEPPRAARPECEAELFVAQRAIDMRKQGEPLDRVLRIQEIAWQESPQRQERLASVATRWFNYSSDFSPEALRIAVINACEQATPAS